MILISNALFCVAERDLSDFGSETFKTIQQYRIIRKRKIIRFKANTRHLATQESCSCI